MGIADLRWGVSGRRGASGEGVPLSRVRGGKPGQAGPGRRSGARGTCAGCLSATIRPGRGCAALAVGSAPRSTGAVPAGATVACQADAAVGKKPGKGVPAAVFVEHVTDGPGAGVVPRHPRVPRPQRPVVAQAGPEPCHMVPPLAISGPVVPSACGPFRRKDMGADQIADRQPRPLASVTPCDGLFRRSGPFRHPSSGVGAPRIERQPNLKAGASRTFIRTPGSQSHETRS